MSTFFTKQEFIDVYKQHHAEILAYCLARASDKTRTEELSDHIFMKAWEHILGGARVENISAFLREIADGLIKEKDNLYRDIMAFSILSSNRVMHHSFAH